MVGKLSPTISPDIAGSATSAAPPDSSRAWSRHAIPICAAPRWILPVVVPIAERRIAAAGLDDRVTARGIDFFGDPLPAADAITMGMILHDWNLEKKLQLIRAAYEALRPGGALVSIEHLIDDARRENAFRPMMSLKHADRVRRFVRLHRCRLRRLVRGAGWLREVGRDHSTGVRREVTASSAKAGTACERHHVEGALETHGVAGPFRAHPRRHHPSFARPSDGRWFSIDAIDLREVVRPANAFGSCRPSEPVESDFFKRQLGHYIRQAQ